MSAFYLLYHVLIQLLLRFFINSLDFSYKNHTLLGIPWTIQVAVSMKETNKNKSSQQGGK